MVTRLSAPTRLPASAVIEAWLAAAASLPAGLVLSGSVTSIRARISLAVLAAVLVGGACLVAVGRRSGRYLGLATFRMGSVWVVYYTLVFGVTSLAWVHHQRGSAAIIQQSSVPGAVLAASLGLVAMTVGYRAGPGRLPARTFDRVLRWAQPPGHWRLRFPTVPIFIYLIGLAARLVEIGTGRYAYLANPTSSLGSYAQILADLAKFAQYGLLLMALDALALSRTARARWTFYAAFCTELGFALFSGVKGNLLFTLLIVAIVFAKVRNRLPRRAVAGVLVALVVVIPFNSTYRSYIRGPLGSSGQVVSNSAALADIPSALAASLTSQSPAATLTSTGSYLAKRFREIDNLALIMQRTPSQIPFAGPGGLLLGPVVGLVPRVVWPGKPVEDVGYQFSQQYYNLPPTQYTSSAITLPGSLYRYGGLPALLIGMALIGAAVRLVDDCADPSRDYRRLLFYIPMFLLLTYLEGDIILTVVTAIELTAILALVSRLAFVSDRRERIES